MSSENIKISKKKVIFFIHIPKTAGSTVREMMRRNLPHQLLEMPHHFFEGPISKKNLSFWLKEDKGTSAVASHRLSLDLPWSEPSLDCRAFTIVRDPLAWLRSQYFYCKKAGIVSFSKSVNYDSFDQFIKDLIDGQTSHNWVNGQSKFLLQSTGLDIHHLIASKRLRLIPQDRLQEGALKFEIEMPEFFKDASLAALNVNPDTQHCSSELPLKLQARFEDLFAEDYKLYEQACNQLNQWIVNQGSGWDLRLKHFKRRCSVRAKIKQPIQSFFGRLSQVFARW